MGQLSPIPKKKPDPESDELEKVQRDGWTARENERMEIREFFEEEENKQDVMDYIFGKADENPLGEIRTKYAKYAR